MHALTVQPGVPHSIQLEERWIPDPASGSVLVRTIELGVCGTDREIIAGEYGSAPLGQSRLVLGHEVLGQVADAPTGGAIAPGALVVGIVRRPDPVPCPNCAAGEWDMCRNGQYTEHGIKSLDGFASEYFRMNPEDVVAVDPTLGALGVLTEPTTIVAKAWEQVERIGRRALWSPRRVLVTGAGPVGLLAALLGVQRDCEVHLLDRATDGPKPEAARALGVTYYASPRDDPPSDFDVVFECTGAPQLALEVAARTAPNGIVCLLGVSPPDGVRPIDVAALSRRLVLGNRVIVGSVNANRRHYEAAVRALAAAPRDWLRRLITRRVPLSNWREAFERRPGDIKTVIVFDAPASAAGPA